MWQIPHSVARDLYRYTREILKYTQNTHTATCWAEQRPSNGGHTHIVKWHSVKIPDSISGLSQVPDPGESPGWENTCSGSQVSRCCTGWHWWTRDLVTDELRDTGPHDILVTMTRMSWCHGHLNTSTVRHPPSVTEPHLRQAVQCLSVYIYTCLAVVLSCLTVCVFLRFYFDNQTIIMLTLHSQETPNNTDQVGATVVTWLSRWARDTWHLCHESVAPVVTSGLLSLLAEDHQSSHLGGQRAPSCVLFWPKQDNSSDFCVAWSPWHNMQKVDIKITRLFSFVETRSKNLSAPWVVSSALITQIWWYDQIRG